MASKTQAKPKASKTAPATEPTEGTSLYLGCFSADSFGKEEKSSTFQVVVEASGPEAALDWCEQRITSLEKELFQEQTTVYLQGLLQLGGSLKKGVLVNFESGPASTWTESALLPEPKPGITQFGWQGADGQEADDHTMHPFMELGADEKPKKKAAPAKAKAAPSKKKTAPAKKKAAKKRA